MNTLVIVDGIILNNRIINEDSNKLNYQKCKFKTLLCRFY